jgi:putative methyltransferase (TIGR04325 family)
LSFALTSQIKETLRQLTPPLIWKVLKRRHWGFYGHYKNFEAAPAKENFYAEEIIFERVKEAFAVFDRGEAYFERDSRPIRERVYNWPIIGLIQSFGKVKVLDFGGGFGTAYWQNLEFIKDHLTSWTIVEQGHYVDYLKPKFKGHPQLRFCKTIDEAEKPDVVILSGVIQYIAEPYKLLSQIKALDAKYIIFDRTPMVKEGEERVTVQKLNPKIYPVDLKAWFLNERKLVDFFSREYSWVCRFNESPIEIEEGQGFYEGYYFRKRDQTPARAGER